MKALGFERRQQTECFKLNSNNEWELDISSKYYTTSVADLRNIIQVLKIEHKKKHPSQGSGGISNINELKIHAFGDKNDCYLSIAVPSHYSDNEVEDISAYLKELYLDIIKLKTNEVALKSELKKNRLKEREILSGKDTTEEDKEQLKKTIVDIEEKLEIISGNSTLGRIDLNNTLNLAQDSNNDEVLKIIRDKVNKDEILSLKEKNQIKNDPNFKTIILEVKISSLKINTFKVKLTQTELDKFNFKHSITSGSKELTISTEVQNHDYYHLLSICLKKEITLTIELEADIVLRSATTETKLEALALNYNSNISLEKLEKEMFNLISKAPLNKNLDFSID